MSKFSISDRRRKELAERMQHLGVRHDEIGCLNPNSNCHSIIMAPVRKIVEGGPQRRNQALINFVGDQFDGVWFGIMGDKRLQGCTAENAGAGGGIKESKPRSTGCDFRGHKISHKNRREIKTMRFAVLVGLAFDVPLTDTIKRTTLGRSPCRGIGIAGVSTGAH